MFKFVFEETFTVDVESLVLIFRTFSEDSVNKQNCYTNKKHFNSKEK